MSILKVNDIRRATTGSSTLVFNDPVTITSGTISASVLVGSLPGAVSIGDGTIGKEKLTNDARDWVNILNKPNGLLSSSAQLPSAVSGTFISPAGITASGVIFTSGTFSGSGAGLSSIPNSALANSSITINGTPTALGASRTLVTADISESTNLYYTDARVKSKLSAEAVVSSTGQINYQSVTGQPSVNTLGSDGNKSFTITTGIFITGSTGIDITNDSANAKVTIKTVGGTVSSSAQINAGLPVGVVSSSAQYPGWITSSTQVVQSLPANTVSSSTQVKTFLPDGTVSASAQYPGWITSSTQVVQALPGGTVSSSAQYSGWVTSSAQIIVQNTTGIGAIATTGSNTFIGNQIISGSTTITGDLTVQGTSSVLYVTSSQLNVGSNTITLNTTDILRFGGLTVFDSASAGQSGSLFWDSVNNVWLYVHAGTSNTSSILITGPENTGALGNEQFLTPNLLPKAGLIGDHIVNSQISDDGTQVGIVGGLKVTGSITSSHIVPAITDIYDLGSPSLKFRSLYLSGSTLYLGTLALSDVGGALSVSPSGSPAGTNSPVSGAFTGSFKGDASQLTNISSTALPGGVVSSSTQLPAGTVSSSTQIANNLPAGTVSSSGQINATSTTGFTSGVEQLLKDNNVHSASFLGTATTNNLSEGFTNLYYTDARVKTKLNVEAVHSGSSLGTATTTNLTEGTNLYFTNARVIDALPTNTVSSSNQVNIFLPAGTVSSSTQVDLAQAFNTASRAVTASYALVSLGTTATNTDGLPEGTTNLYYTDARVKTKMNADVVHSGSFLGTATTTNLTEGINLYFTNARVVNALPAGTVSSSTQVAIAGAISSSTQFKTLSDPFSGSFTGSFTGDGTNLTGIATTLNVTGSTSGQSAINLKTSGLLFSGENGISATVSSSTVTLTAPAGTVSASSQVDYNSITNKLSGVYSSSTQTVASLSGQSVQFSGSQFSGIVSGSGTQYRLVVPVGTNLYAT